MPRRSPHLLLAATACLVASLVGCGGSDGDPDPPAPTQPEVDPLDQLEELRAIGYTQWEDAGEEKRAGVTHWDKERAQPGYNLFANDADEAYLMSMGGRRVHTWKFPSGKHCEYVHLRPDGSVLAVFVGHSVAAYDWNSQLLWRQDVSAHHDIGVAPDGSLWVPIHLRTRQYQGRRVRFDGMVHVSATGEVLRRWSSFRHLAELQQYHQLSGLDESTPRASTRRYDYYHLNSVQVLPATALGETDERFRAGNLLIHLRNANLTVILDPQTFEVLWHYGPDTLDLAHMPRLLRGGTMLIFDNGTKRGWSRVLEIDPVSKEVVWSYQTEPPEEFFSRWQGGAQRLKNGNTLICEATRGRVLEVTPEGETVWEFFHQLAGGRRKTVYRMTRVPVRRVDDLLRRR